LRRRRFQLTCQDEAAQIEAIALSKMQRGDFSGDGATVSTEDLTA
jgi:hypothetical protein